MNNLLRTLTATQAASGNGEDLKILLTAVKEARRQYHDTKTSDAFYDSLEGLLQDLRTVTQDNRDAEAFLKPVARSEVPDYYDVIHHPMDLATMQKKVKQKQYKSKREFQDDLDLIWSNCFTYNATENHPLRQCASRLRAKADTLLKNITDRKERADPTIPPSLASRDGTPRTNGLNGHAVTRTRPVAFTKSPSPSKLSSSSSGTHRQIRRDVPFPEQSAIIRTAEGMSTFRQLDRELDSRLQGQVRANGFSGPSLEEKLQDYVVAGTDTDDDDLMTIDGEVGGKRKLNGHTDVWPRKRARNTPVDKDAHDLWWDAMQSDAMIANGLPVLQHASSEDPSDTSHPIVIRDSPRKHANRSRKKQKQAEPGAQKTLLYHINNNIRTFRRVQNTHIKLGALKESMNADESQGGGPSVPDVPPPLFNELDDIVDERPWRVPVSGLEIGEETANDCLRWTSTKVLQHAGFSGSSKVALDVMVGLAADYLNSLGRTIQYLCDEFAGKMTPEEIILHALFSSGITHVNELERYIKDDILRWGTRISDLEKKLNNAHEELTSNEIWDDNALFRMQNDSEDEGEFVTGNFADSFGEDFFGFRELGIADEFNLTSLAVPKKLLRSKKAGPKDIEAKKPTEPPPPFPPPPLFVPLDSKHLDDQIGLLKPYYQTRIDTLAAPPPPPQQPPPMIPPPLPLLAGPTINAPYAIPPMQPIPQLPQPPPPAQPVIAPPASPPLVVLPDDAAPLVHTKMGPLGQIVKSVPAASNAKKKAAAKPKVPTVPGSGVLDGTDLVPDTPAATPSAIAPDTPKKPKGTPAKKKKNAIEILPPVTAAGA